MLFTEIQAFQQGSQEQSTIKEQSIIQKETSLQLQQQEQLLEVQLVMEVQVLDQLDLLDSLEKEATTLNQGQQQEVSLMGVKYREDHLQHQDIVIKNLKGIFFSALEQVGSKDFIQEQEGHFREFLKLPDHPTSLILDDLNFFHKIFIQLFMFC